MRIPRRRGQGASRRPRSLAASLAILTSLAPLGSMAINFTTVPSPNLDFSNLGKIGVAGNFNGISLYQYTDQSGVQPSTNGSQSLLAMLPDGELGTVVATDASIISMCMFSLSNGQMQGVVMAGNFTSLDGTESTAIALFNPNTTQITPLSGLQGEVNAVYCDNERDTVYVGGNFKGGNSTNAIAWYGNEGWTNLPFAGFNGPVEAITQAADGHIIFGGSFTGLGNASAPNQPDGQIINLSTANVTADASSTTAGFSDPTNIVCSSGQDTAGTTWLAQDNTPASWNADFSFGFEPTKLRLWNTHQGGRGTKTFRFIALPINGIMNFTYVDPATGKNASCSSECPLSSDSSVQYQDFHFVNLVGMNSFQVAISAWYGSGAGLAGIELFEDNIFSYAVTRFNEPSCRTGGSSPSVATATGPWSESPSLQSTSTYLTANVTGNIGPRSGSVVFTPNIQESGNYTVNIYTPGCVPDNTCSTRGRVNVTGTMSTGTTSANFTTSLYQTNDFDKYDQIYFGYIEKSSDAFQPTVTLTPLAGQNINFQTVVAQRVGFTYLNSSGGLNGLFDFNPNEAVVNTSDFQNSAVDKLGSSFTQNSAVKSLITANGVTYVGGNFTSSDHVNILAIDSNNQVKDLDGGLNGQVLDMQLENNTLFVGGDFSDTLTGNVDGLNHVGMFDISKDSWNALGAGVNGQVYYVVPMQVNITNSPETVLAFSGFFTQINAFGDNAAVAVDGFAVWVPSQDNWLQNVNATVPSYTGMLTTALLNLPEGGSIYAGSMTSAEISVNGAATLANSGLGRFPVDIESQTSSSSSSQNQRRDVLSPGSIDGVVTGYFYDENSQNITVLAGHFAAKTANGSTVNNLVLIDGGNDNSVASLGSGIATNSTFYSLDVQGSVLYAGGEVSGTVKGDKVNGIVAYDLSSGSLANQLPPVSGGNSTVYAVSVRPKNEEVYIGGSFDQAGALDCPAVCMYNIKNDQWIRPGTQLAGNVSSLLWVSDSELVAGGSMQGNGSDTTYLAMYNAKKDKWTTYPGADSIPGPVQVLTPASSNRDQIWVAGVSAKNASVFLMKYDGSKWIPAGQTLPSGTEVRSIQVFSVTKNHDNTNILDKSQVLMLTGSIVLPGFGTAAAAIYNGTTFQPYALTTSSSTSFGSIAQIFTQNDNFFSTSGHHMPLVFVILIGLAVSLALILLIVVAGIILDRLRKKREGYVPAPTSMYDRGGGIRRIPPRELLQSLGKGAPGAPRV